MDIESRKKLVSRLLTNARQRAAREAEILRSEPDPTCEFIYEHLRKYILAKLLLTEESEESGLMDLIEKSLASSMKLDKKILKELDSARTCDNMSSASTKKVMLLFAIRKDLKINPDAAELTTRATLAELAELVHSLL